MSALTDKWDREHEQRKREELNDMAAALEKFTLEHDPSLDPISVSHFVRDFLWTFYPEMFTNG